MTRSEVKSQLDQIYETELEIPFLEDDPIQIPHQYTVLQDIEITAFWTAMLAWGQRKTIINKSTELFALMDNDPYLFILNLDDEKRRRFTEFKHRTFNATDTLYFLEVLHTWYNESESMEDYFLVNGRFDASDSITHFHNHFFSLEFAPKRTRKHVATPAKNSACKRLNLFLKWMVRKDEKSGDLGVWNRITKSELVIPVDVHVMNTAVTLGLLKRKQVNWKLAIQLNDILVKFDPSDPVKYDYPLFVYSRYKDLLMI